MSEEKNIRKVWRSAEYEEIDSAIKKIYEHANSVFTEVDFDLVEVALLLISKINREKGSMELPPE